MQEMSFMEYKLQTAEEHFIVENKNVYKFWLNFYNTQPQVSQIRMG